MALHFGEALPVGWAQPGYHAVSSGSRWERISHGVVKIAKHVDWRVATPNWRRAGFIVREHLSVLCQWISGTAEWATYICMSIGARTLLDFTHSCVTVFLSGGTKVHLKSRFFAPKYQVTLVTYTFKYETPLTSGVSHWMY